MPAPFRDPIAPPAASRATWRRALAFALVALVAAGCVHRDNSQVERLPAAGRAVAFLAREVPAWSRQNGCFSCHNNGDGARALCLAAARGYRVPTHALRDTTSWVTHPERWSHNRGDPGFADERLANLQFAATLLASVESQAGLSRRPLREAARRVAADQDPDGKWPVGPQNPAGSPATYGTTLATFIAWRVLARSEDADVEPARQRAERWLSGAKPNPMVNTATLLLAATELSTNTSPARFPVDACLEILRRTQTREGGWGPYADTPAEPFDTALALLALARWRHADGIEERLRRGRAYLLSQQEADGGWAATTRPPGGDSYAQRISTTAWVLQALLETEADRPIFSLLRQESCAKQSLSAQK